MVQVYNASLKQGQIQVYKTRLYYRSTIQATRGPTIGWWLSLEGKKAETTTCEFSRFSYHRPIERNEQNFEANNQSYFSSFETIEEVRVHELRSKIETFGWKHQSCRHRRRPTDWSPTDRSPSKVWGLRPASLDLQTWPCCHWLLGQSIEVLQSQASPWLPRLTGARLCNFTNCSH